jgi:hypothetical protein
MIQFSPFSLETIGSEHGEGEDVSVGLSAGIKRHSLHNSGVLEKCLSHLSLDRIVAGERVNHEQGAHLEHCLDCQNSLKMLSAHQTQAQMDVSRLIDRSAFELARQELKTSSGEDVSSRRWLLFNRFRSLVLGYLRSWNDYIEGGLRSLMPSRWALAAALGSGLVVTTVALQAPIGESAMPLPERQLEVVTEAPSIRTKGSRLDYYVQRGAEVLPSSKIHHFRSDDAIQFVLAAGPSVHFLLLGLADDGAQTVYFPHNGRKSILVDGAQRWTLPHSLVLDDSEETETLVAVLSPQSIDVSKLKKRLKEMGSQERKQLGRPKASDELGDFGEMYFLKLRKEN